MSMTTFQSKSIRRLGLMLALLVFWAAPAWAAPSLVAHLSAHEVVGLPGHEHLRPATHALPGDIVEYQATYRNAGTGVITNLAVRLPVPFA